MKLYLNALFFAFICLFQMNATLKVYEAVPSEDSPYAGREIYLLPTMHQKAFKSLSKNTQNFLTEIQEANGYLFHEGGESENEKWIAKLMEFEAEDQDKYIEFCQQPAVQEVINRCIDEYEGISREQILASPILLIFVKLGLTSMECYQGEDAFDYKLIDMFEGKSLALENMWESLYHFMNRKGEGNKISYDDYTGTFNRISKVLPGQVKAVEDLYEAQDLLTYSVPQLNKDLGQKLGI